MQTWPGPDTWTPPPETDLAESHAPIPISAARARAPRRHTRTDLRAGMIRWDATTTVIDSVGLLVAVGIAVVAIATTTR